MKCSFLVASTSDPAAQLKALPQLDIAASDALATKILGKRSWGRSRRAHRSGDLANDVYPRFDEVAVGVYGDVTIVAYEDAADWVSSAVPAWGAPLLERGDVDVFILHSVVDMGVFTFWRNREVIRSFGGAEQEVIVDDGARLPFEQHVVEDDTFEWVTELAILDRLGYCYEGPRTPDAIDPATVPLLVYR